MVKANPSFYFPPLIITRKKKKV